MRTRARIKFALIALLALFFIVPNAAMAQSEAPRVEVTFVLDTTGSMSGLIEGAKAKIWDIANLIVSAEPTPDVRFGLIGYRDRGDDYVTQVFDLTDDIDAIYGHLMGFSAAGGGDGPESVQQALSEAVTQMSWTPVSGDETVLRIIFLVGDAPPHTDYGDTPYLESAASAAAAGIIVNTIQCGTDPATASIWQEISRRADGAFTAIAQDGAVAVIETPFDAELARLNAEFNATIIGYGGAEDIRAMEGYAVVAEEAAPSASADRLAFRRNLGTIAGGGGGDLIDGLNSGSLTLAELDEDSLPDELRNLSEEERAAFIAERQSQRAELQTEIDALLLQRRDFIDAERDRMSADSGLTGFDAEVNRMIVDQAEAVGINFD